MTKGRIIKQFFKKMNNMDLKGNSMITVLRDYYKQKYNYTPKGSTLVAMLEDCMENNIGGKLYD